MTTTGALPTSTAQPPQTEVPVVKTDSEAIASSASGSRKAPAANGNDLSLYAGLVLPTDAGATAASPLTVSAPAPKNAAPASAAPVADDGDDDSADIDTATGDKADTSTGAAVATSDANTSGNPNTGADGNSGNSSAKSEDFTQILQGAPTAKEKSAAAQSGSPASFADAVKSSVTGTNLGQNTTNVQAGSSTSSTFATGFNQGNSTTATNFIQATPEQIAIVLQRAASNQVQSMTIQLDPAELGKIEVKLNFGKDGAVSASVTADRPQTLAMLKNDQGSLTQALQNAGLSPDSASLDFNLSGHGQEQAQQDQSASQGRSQNFNLEAGIPATTQTAYSLQASSNGRLDLLV